MTHPYDIYHLDCLEALSLYIPDNSIDAIVTDPPYGLSFMGKKWDYDVPSVEVWAECLRVLKPGGHLLAFAGTRTQHRMAVRIEDAGFEIRDLIAWVYGSGMPKHQSSLKPALEPITVARKRAEKATLLNIDACRVPVVGEVINTPQSDPSKRVVVVGSDLGISNADIAKFQAAQRASVEKAMTLGRYPANLIHDGSDEVLAAFPQAKGQQGALTGAEPSSKTANTFGDFAGRTPSEPRGDTGSAARFFKQIEVTDAEWLENLSPALIAGNTLSLSKLADAIAQSDAAISALPDGRQLNVLKAPSTSVTPSESKLIATSVITAIQSIASASWLAQQPERLSLSHNHVSVVAHQTPTGITMITVNLSSSAGCAESITFSITPKSLAVGEKGCGQSPARFVYCAKASKKDRGEGNNHNTVKPTDLMAYLCRLVTPPGGVVLDPFMGSGSTGKAAIREGFRFIGIEREAQYVEIARARIEAELAKRG